MADRRMMSKKITDTDAFLEMPLSSQALYFHFIQNADDDGFVGNPNSIIRKIGANRNDYDLLVAKRFVLIFPTGICVIKHWRIHNYIQNDRYTPTTYLEEKSLLMIEDNKAYTERCIQDVSKAYPQISIDKYSIEESNKDIMPTEDKSEVISDTETLSVVSQFNTLYKIYPCSINKQKKTSLNLYYGWLVGKQVSIMGSKKTTRYNHLQILFALKQFIADNKNTEEHYIPRLPTFLGERTLCDYVESSKMSYEEYMNQHYGTEWEKVKFAYSKDIGDE